MSFYLFSITGASAAILGVLAAGFAYRGKEGEPYSLLNHFISELGEAGVSRLSWVFNFGLILSGISLVGASISLGLILPGILAKIGMILGIICSIALTFVGLFPMDKIKPHGHAALTYFRSGLLMMIFFNLAIAFQPEGLQVLPRIYSLAGVPAIISFTSFLFLIQGSTRKKDADPLSTEEVERPKIWPIAIVEWSIFITIVTWFVVIGVGL